MAPWNSTHLRTHMSVFSSDKQDMGRISNVYKDSFQVAHGTIFPKHRYLPYSAVLLIDENTVHLNMSAEEIQEKKWEIRPEYEKHLGDPTQLFYDRGHGAHDPFDETNTTK